MILVVILLILTSPFSLEESAILQIPLRRSVTKRMDAKVTSNHYSTAEHALSADDSNYNLHGILGQGYYIELAIGQPRQLVNNIHII